MNRHDDLPALRWAPDPVRRATRRGGPSLASILCALVTVAATACGTDAPVSGATADAAAADSHGPDGSLDSVAVGIDAKPTNPGTPGTATDADVAAGLDTTVRPPPDVSVPVPTALTLEPAALAMPLGAAAQVQAMLAWTDGTTEDVTTLANWSIDLANVATATHGFVTALAPGQATLTAVHLGLQAKLAITVGQSAVKALAIAPAALNLNVGGKAQFAALASLEDGSVQDATALAVWTTASPEVATIAQGAVVGVAAGSTSVTASLGAVKASASVTVLPAPVVSIAVGPVSPTLAVGMKLALQAIATYEDGKVADVTGAALWNASDPGVLAIVQGGVQAGLATALAAGSSLATASFGGQTGTTAVTVLPIHLTSLAVEPASLQLPAGTSAALVAKGTWSDKSVSDLTQSVAWTSSSPAVATVANAPGKKGKVDAVHAGTATVTATFAGKAAGVAITVTAATLTKLAIAPQNPALPKATTLPLQALGFFSDGASKDVTADVVWQVADAKVVAVSNAGASKGVITALEPGQSAVSAAIGSVAATTTVTVTPATLTQVQIEPNPLELAVGQKHKCKLVGTYTDAATADLTALAVWTASNDKVISVSNVGGAAGIVSTLGPGSATLTATVQGKTASATVKVTAPALVDVVVTPPHPERHAGQQVQFAATAIYTNNTTLNVTQQAIWSSTDPTIADATGTGNQTGLFKATGVGKADIAAAWGGKIGKTSFTVSGAVLVDVQLTPVVFAMPAGIVQFFQAVALWSDNTSQNVTWQADWVSGNQAVAAVQNTPIFARGRVTAIQPGQAELKATYQGMTGKALVTVTPALLAGIHLFPAVATAAQGMYRAFSAQALYTDNTSLDVTFQATWLSSDPKVVLVSNAFGGVAGYKGLAKAVGPGTAKITANYQGLLGAATFSVTPATLESIQISPGTATVSKGVPVKFDVLAVWSDGQAQDVSWATTFTSTDPSVAAVSDAFGSAGWSQTLKPGTVTIQGVYAGLIAKAKLTVTDAVVSSIQVTPTQPKVAKGTWFGLQAVALMTDGTSQQVTWGATWQSSNPAVAAVDGVGFGKGLVQAVAAGTTTVSAAWGGKSGTTTVTVTAAALSEVQVTPFLLTLPLGYSRPFQATALYSDDTTEDLTQLATWTTSAPALGTVSSAWPTKGAFTPVSAGKVLVQATWGGKTGAATVTVTDAKLASLAVQPAQSSATVGKIVAFTAAGSFADGLLLDVTQDVTWLSAAPTVCQVSNALDGKGKAQALGPGNCEIKAVKGPISAKAVLSVPAP
ncbi:MAG: hypothetical protein EXR79_11265 [Myxococcales bacterium]|nr:hypothetical protein [Myxococcales bacterium]